MASPTDFMDFSAWRDLAGQSEQDALNRQTSDLQKKSAEAQRLLRQANRDTEAAQARELGGAGAYGADATGSAHTTLSQVGSYGDYLKAKQSAQNAAALLANSGGGEYGAVRGVMNQAGNYSANAVGELAGIQSNEDRYGAARDASLASSNAFAATQRTASQKARDEQKARQAQDEASNTQMLDYYKSMMAPGGKFRGGMDYTSAAQRYLALQQRTGEHGWDNRGFDPESRAAANGLEVRSMAYGDEVDINRPNQRAKSELRWGNYGKK